MPKDGMSKALLRAALDGANEDAVYFRDQFVAEREKARKFEAELREQHARGVQELAQAFTRTGLEAGRAGKLEQAVIDLSHVLAWMIAND